MKFKYTKAPLAIFGLIVIILAGKLLLNGSHTLQPNSDGSISYKTMGEADDYLFKINDKVAFRAHILPSMQTISIDIVEYRKAGFIKGFFLGWNVPGQPLFYPTDMKGDWVLTPVAHKDEYFAINTKTGELLKNETDNDTLYVTDYFKEKFSDAKSLEDTYVLKNFKPISTYKRSGEDLIIAGVLLAIICLIWFLIALLVGVVKTGRKKA